MQLICELINESVGDVLGTKQVFVYSLIAKAYHISETMVDKELKEKVLHEIKLGLFHRASDWADKNHSWANAGLAEKIQSDLSRHAEKASKIMKVVSVGAAATFFACKIYNAMKCEKEAEKIVMSAKPLYTHFF